MFSLIVTGDSSGVSFRISHGRGAGVLKCFVHSLYPMENRMLQPRSAFTGNCHLFEDVGQIKLITDRSDRSRSQAGWDRTRSPDCPPIGEGTGSPARDHRDYPDHVEHPRPPVPAVVLPFEYPEYLDTTWFAVILILFQTLNIPEIPVRQQPMQVLCPTR